MNRSSQTRRGVLARSLPLAAAPLMACTGRRELPPTGAKRSAPVTLRYAGLLTPIPTNTFAEGTNKVIDLFNALGTGVTVQPEEPKPLAEGILAQVAGGNPPDLVHAHPRDYLPYVDVVRELDTYFKQEKKVVPDILPSVLEYWLWGGKHLGMPNNMSVQSVYFNKALFEKQGLKTPDQYEREGGWTFDVYLDLARKLTTGAGGDKVWGAPWTTNALDIQLGYLWPMGGEMWDKEVKTTLLDTKESLEAMQFQADLTAKYGVSPDAEETKTLTRATGGALAMERGGMEVLTNNALSLLAPATFPKGMAPMPKGRAGRVIRGVAVGLALVKDSKQNDAAWEYAVFQAGPEGEKVMLDLNLTTPWRRSRFSTNDYAKTLLPWENVTYYTDALKAVRPTAYPKAFVPIQQLYASAYDQVRAGQQTAGPAVAAIKGQINELLRQGGR